MKNGILREDKPKDKKQELITNGGYRLDEVVSSLQKCIRKGLELETLFWAEEMIDSGYDAYCWRRLQVIVAEDIGLANIQVVILVKSLADMWKQMKEEKRQPEKNIVALAICSMCRSNKNRTSDDLCEYLRVKKEKGLKLEIREEFRDGHTAAGKVKLKKESIRTGESFFQCWNREFFENVGRLNKPTEVKGPNWSKKLVKYLGLDYNKCMEPTKEESEFTEEGR